MDVDIDLECSKVLDSDVTFGGKDLDITMASGGSMAYGQVP